MPEVKYGPTPGPWKITDRSTYGMHANAARWEIGQKSGMEPYWVALAINEDNARLIAAAPDLYTALKKAVYELNTIRARDGIPWTGVPFPMKTDVSEEYFSSVVDECFAAIAKAEGR